ncbi:MAG: Disulfide bond formation protein C [Microgenomates bacterium OLB22]|nr:MAG: Disulfide bond formation protein C [Microgenomates bacterium OLB22]
MTKIITDFLSLLTVLALVFSALLLLDLILGILTKRSSGIIPKRMASAIRAQTVPYITLIATIAMAGSLYFSDIAGYAPCKLCWLQRIAMYPLVVLGLVGISRRDNGAIIYITPLAIIGGLIAAYHYYHQILPNLSIPCSTVGYSVSCSERFFMTYGFVTIPMMALAAFGFILSLIIYSKRKA